MTIQSIWMESSLGIPWEAIEPHGNHHFQISKGW